MFCSGDRDVGIVWTGLEKTLLQVVGLVQSVILARILSPHDFGLVAMLGIFLCLGNDLAESGLGTAYVVYGGNGRKVLSWNVGVALVIYGLLVLVAPAIACFYSQPVLKPLLWVMGLGVVINAACVLGNARLQRAQRFLALSTVNCITAVFACFVVVSLALLGWGVWAIAVMTVCGAVVRLGQLMWSTRSVPRINERGPIRPLLSYGWKLTLSGVIHSFYLNCYQFVIGKVFSPASVGLFTRGQRWAALPVDLINDSIARVALPNVAAGTVGTKRYFVRNVVLLWPALVLLWLFAPDVVKLVLGMQWSGCVPYMRVLIVGVFMTPFTNASMLYLRAKKRSDLILVTDAIKKPIQFSLLVSAGLWAVARQDGLGVAVLCWAKVASDFVEAIVDFCVARKFHLQIGNRAYIDDPSIRSALSKVHTAQRLDKFLSGKTIAVVGNGPGEIGKGLGMEIDGHDVVIRFNNYQTKGFENDYGSRTDVWMKGGTDDVRHELRNEEIRVILYTDDLLVKGIKKGCVTLLKDELQTRIVDYIDSSTLGEAARKIGANPTSGALLIERLRQVPGVTVDVYGFHFLWEVSEESFDHYAHDQTLEHRNTMLRIGRHDVARESEWLKGQFRGRRLI